MFSATLVSFFLFVFPEGRVEKLENNRKILGREARQALMNVRPLGRFR